MNNERTMPMARQTPVISANYESLLDITETSSPAGSANPDELEQVATRVWERSLSAAPGRSTMGDRGSNPLPIDGRRGRRHWTVTVLSRLNVCAVGLLIQIVLVRYARMNILTAYVVQAIATTQWNFLLTCHLFWRDQQMRRLRALITFNGRQSAVVSLAIIGFASLERLGINYILSAVIVAAVFSPLSFFPAKSGAMAEPGNERRRARLVILTGLGTAVVVTGFIAMGSAALALAMAFSSLFNLGVAGVESFWRFYALRNPEAKEQLEWPEPIKPGQELMSFSSIVCALDEADVIGVTLAGLITQTHRRHQIIVSLREHDAATITAVQEFQRVNPGTVELLIGRYTVSGKHAQLNGALPHCTGDYIGPIDSEDDVAPELLVHVESMIRRTGADIVQGAVQLMNLGDTWQEWYKVHNVEEYRAWYSSRMAFQVSAGFVPLGGNTVYTRASLLREAGGWPASPTEDCAAGVLMCTRFGAKVVAAHSPELATREEVPGAIFNKEIGSLFWQRVRWLQGIFQELVQFTWLQMPTRRQRLLAGYILAAPILQAASCALIGFAIFTAVAVKIPVGLAMFMFTPVIPIALTMTSMLIGVRTFGRDYDQRIRLRHYASILFLTPIYQVILAMAAVVAVGKHMRGDQGWYKTGRMNQHRSASMTEAAS